MSQYHSQNPWKLPNHWEWAPIKEIGQVISGGTPSTKSKEYWNGTVNWISPADLSGFNGKYIASGAKSISQLGLDKSSAKLLPKDAVLFSSRAPVGYVAIAAEPLATNQGFKNLVPQSGMDPEYLYYYLKASKDLAEARASGTTFKEISGKAFSQLPVAVPPFNEQRRIVAKIEELFSELDKGVESLKAARAQLKTYRQSLLKAAFEGRLTEQWRRDNADKLETADQLLQRIHKEREARFQQQLEDWKAAVSKWEECNRQGKRPIKPRKIKPSSVESIDQSLGLPALPKEWGWGTAEELIDSAPYALGIGPFGSNLKVSDYRDQGVPLVFVKNITQNNFRDGRKYVSQEKADELYAHQAQPGDILITKMGDPPGDATIYPEDESTCVITADCLKFRINSKFFDKKFVTYFINSVFAKNQLGLITRGVAQKKISVARFKGVRFPMLSLSEQVRIANQVDAKISQLVELELVIDFSLKRKEALRQSILKRAFEGKLVPQDPDDEPASVLLERIRAEREEAPRTRGRRRKANA